MCQQACVFHRTLQVIYSTQQKYSIHMHVHSAVFGRFNVVIDSSSIEILRFSNCCIKL